MVNELVLRIVRSSALQILIDKRHTKSKLKVL